MIETKTKQRAKKPAKVVSMDGGKELALKLIADLVDELGSLEASIPPKVVRDLKRIDAIRKSLRHTLEAYPPTTGSLPGEYYVAVYGAPTTERRSTSLRDAHDAIGPKFFELMCATHQSKIIDALVQINRGDLIRETQTGPRTLVCAQRNPTAPTNVSIAPDITTTHN